MSTPTAPSSPSPKKGLPPLSNYQDGDCRITSFHPEILQTHILPRLDGPTLAAAACTSSELRSLSTEKGLWRKICASTWPSVNDPIVSHVVSTFPSGHRSFFSDSFPLLHHNRRLCSPNRSFPVTTKLISAVDVYYRNVPILSKVVETETLTGWFMCSPFRIDLQELKESVQNTIKQDKMDRQNDSWLNELEENMTLSWILIDPNRKRAVNLSTHRPVSAKRHWLTAEVQVKFAAVMATGYSDEREYVECGVVVTCGGGEVHVKEVSMGMGDMEGKTLSGKDSLVILQGAMEGGERRGRKESEKEGKVRFEEFLDRKRLWRERKERRERALDSACLASGVTVFLLFWWFILFR